MSTTARVQPGVPTGGQFTATARARADEADLDMGPTVVPAHEHLDDTLASLSEEFGERGQLSEDDVVEMATRAAAVMVRSGPTVAESIAAARATAAVEPDTQEADEVEPEWSIRHDQRQEIVRQIGTGNILSISGGRVKALKDGIELPVSNGYKVRVRLMPNDTYTVSRVFVRGGREFPKGEKTDVYFDDVSNQAYRAGMFQSYDEDEW